MRRFLILPLILFVSLGPLLNTVSAQDPLPDNIKSGNEGTVTASNGIYDIFVEDNAPGIGTYTARTGASHPVTLSTGTSQNVLYGGAWGTPYTSFNTIRSYTSETDYTQGSGHTSTLNVVNLDSYVVGTTPIGAIGFRTAWELPGTPTAPDRLEILQDVKIIGTTFQDSAIEVTTQITNLGTDVVNLGVRYLWDFQIGEDDGPVFLQVDPDAPALLTEAEFESPNFDFYRIQDNDLNPNPPIFRVNGTAKGPQGFVPPPDVPRVLQNVCWPEAFDMAFDYTVNPSRDVATTASNCRGFAGGDTAAVYLFGSDAENAISLSSNATIRITAYIFVTSPPPASLADTDGDGLFDIWEIEGFDFDGDGNPDVDLPAMGADLLRPDIFVEIDWMEDDEHSHRPNSEAIDLIVEAFDRQGIALHVDLGEPVPHSNLLGTTVRGQYDWSDFAAIKRDYFSPARAPIFHYVLFAHQLFLNILSNGEVRCGPSGVSRNTFDDIGDGASDFIVALGGWYRLFNEDGCDPDPLSKKTGIKEQQAGTFMHELGHNLGLAHGGDPNLPDNLGLINHKPNYLSVMNYLFQMRGLILDGREGNFDYSPSLPGTFFLDENNLNEQLGLIGHGFSGNYGTLRFNCDKDDPKYNILVRNVNGPIDWNCDKEFDDLVVTNVNGDSFPSSELPEEDRFVTGEKLFYFNDWDNLIYKGGLVGSLGISLELPLITSVNEMTPEDAAKIQPFILVDIDVKPGSDPNSINCDNGKEIITVAIITTDDFDATIVDHNTVTFEGASEIHVDRKTGEPRRHEEDVDGDGDVDLVFHFRLGDTALTCASTEANLIGETFEGLAIQGSDNVRMVKK